MSLTSTPKINTDIDDQVEDSTTEIKKKLIKKNHNLLNFEEEYSLGYNNTFNKNYLNRYRTQ